MSPSYPISIYPEELQKKIEKLLHRFETPRSSILPILHAIQDYKDFISTDDVLLLEKEYGLSAVDINEVLTFYSMYRKEHEPAYRICVCNSISCWLAGSEQLLHQIKDKLNELQQKHVEPLPFKLKEVECLGMCGYAPVMLINKERYLNVTPELAYQLISKYLEADIPHAAKVAKKFVQESQNAGNEK